MEDKARHGTSNHKDVGNSAAPEPSRMSAHKNEVAAQESPLDPHPSHTNTYTTLAYHPWVSYTQGISIALPVVALHPAVAGDSVA